MFVSISPDIENELVNEILKFSKQTRTQVPNTFSHLFFKDISQSYFMMLNYVKDFNPMVEILNLRWFYVFKKYIIAIYLIIIMTKHFPAQHNKRDSRDNFPNPTILFVNK